MAEKFIDQLKGKVEDTFDKAKRRFSHEDTGQQMANNAKDETVNAGENMQQSAKQGADKTKNMASNAKDKVEGTAQNAAQKVQDNIPS